MQACAIILEKKIHPSLPFWVIADFRSPFDGVGVLNGDQNSLVLSNNASMSDDNQTFLVAIQYTPPIQW